MQHRVSAYLPESVLTWGWVEVLDDSRLEAGERSDLKVRVLLDRDVPTGCSLNVSLHFVADALPLQTTDPEGPGYFFCEATCPVGAFAPRKAPVHGPGAFFPYRRWAGVNLPNGAAAGDTFVCRFVDAGMQSYEESLFNLRFSILEDDDVLGYLGDAFYEIHGGPAQHLRVVVPTCVETDEVFDGHIIVCDRFGNKSGDDLAELQFQLESCPETDLSSAQTIYEEDRRRHRIAGLRLPNEGVHYLRVQTTDGLLVGRSNPMVCREHWSARVLWGDLHQHACYADGRGTPAANYEYAINTSCLDFCSVAPHQEFTFAPGLLYIDEAPKQSGWEELVAAAEEYNGADLITILGSEAGSLRQLSGDMNSYYLDHANRPELERLQNASGSSDEGVANYQAYLDELERSRGDFLLLPHAHAGGSPGRYDLPERESYQTNVELCSVHGVFEEFYQQWLAAGRHVGVHGGGDNHMTSVGNGRPGNHYPNTNGLAGAWAATTDRSGVWDAFKQRRTLAVTGNQRIFVEFTSDGSEMGEVVAGFTNGRRTFAVAVAGTAPLLKVELLRNNEVIQTFRPEPGKQQWLRVVWSDNVCSRRVDDSQTTGRLQLDQGALQVKEALQTFNRTDAFVNRDGGVDFRTNAYSGITRGVLCELAGHPKRLLLQLQDNLADKRIFAGRLDIALDDLPYAEQHDLDLPTKVVFATEPEPCRLQVRADFVDPDGPQTAEIKWDDAADADAFYYVRVEQIDGNLAWSSPIWFTA